MTLLINMKGDDKFYGKIKPDGVGDSNKLEHPAPPPNPMSNVALTNKLQREEATKRLTNNINDPNSKEKPTIQAELKVKDTQRLKNTKDLTFSERLTTFIDDPLGLNTAEPNQFVPDTEQRLQNREIVSGKTALQQVKNDLYDKPVEAVGDTASDISNRVMSFVETKAMQLVFLIAGVYLASKVIEGAGKSVSKKVEKKVSANLD